MNIIIFNCRLVVAWQFLLYYIAESIIAQQAKDDLLKESFAAKQSTKNNSSALVESILEGMT